MPDDNTIPLTTLTARPGPGGDVRSASEGLAGPHPPVRSLYIHTPFCVHKCHYCDFYSFVDNRDQQGAFVDRLVEELRVLAGHSRGPGGVERVPLRTVFVGGGTPSLLRVELWSRLLDELHRLFDLSLMRSEPGSVGLSGLPPGEFTVECNPESASDELLRVLAAGGVNRVSIGAQSFQQGHLKTLERWHDPANVARAVEAARRAGVARQSVDLIYAIPGQTLDEWRSDVRLALSLGTTHLSCYNLTYEPNTAMTVRLRRGEFTPVDEDTEADMFALTADLLGEAGLERYEVSNYARPGHECSHNLAYWRQEQWLAAGPSSSGHAYGSIGEADALGEPIVASYRWKNTPNLGTYLASAGSGYAPIAECEAPDAARAVREHLMTRLRLAEGINRGWIVARADQACPGSMARLEMQAAELAGDGFLTLERDSWRLTDRGWLLADFVARRMMQCVATD